MSYYPTAHAKSRYMERFGGAVNEFEASSLIRQSFKRSTFYGVDVKKSYIKLYHDSTLDAILVVNEINRTIITTYKRPVQSLWDRIFNSK